MSQTIQPSWQTCKTRLTMESGGAPLKLCALSLKRNTLASLEIIQAIAVLEHNPLIGRPVNALDDDKRELVIGRQAHGYIALYRYIAAIDTGFVLALRGQREAGYSNP